MSKNEIKKTAADAIGTEEKQPADVEISHVVKGDGSSDEQKMVAAQEAVDFKEHFIGNMNEKYMKLAQKVKTVKLDVLKKIEEKANLFLSKMAGKTTLNQLDRESITQLAEIRNSFGSLKFSSRSNAHLFQDVWAETAAQLNKIIDQLQKIYDKFPHGGFTALKLEFLVHYAGICRLYYEFICLTCLSPEGGGFVNLAKEKIDGYIEQVRTLLCEALIFEQDYSEGMEKQLWRVDVYFELARNKFDVLLCQAENEYAQIDCLYDVIASSVKESLKATISCINDLTDRNLYRIYDSILKLIVLISEIQAFYDELVHFDAEMTQLFYVFQAGIDRICSYLFSQEKNQQQFCQGLQNNTQEFYHYQRFLNSFVQKIRAWLEVSPNKTSSNALSINELADRKSSEPTSFLGNCQEMSDMDALTAMNEDRKLNLEKHDEMKKTLQEAETLIAEVNKFLIKFQVLNTPQDQRSCKKALRKIIGEVDRIRADFGAFAMIPEKDSKSFDELLFNGVETLKNLVKKLKAIWHKIDSVKLSDQYGLVKSSVLASLASSIRIYQEYLRLNNGKQPVCEVSLNKLIEEAENIFKEAISIREKDFFPHDYSNNLDFYLMQSEIWFERTTNIFSHFNIRSKLKFIEYNRQDLQNITIYINHVEQYSSDLIYRIIKRIILVQSFLHDTFKEIYFLDNREILIAFKNSLQNVSKKNKNFYNNTSKKWLEKFIDYITKLDSTLSAMSSEERLMLRQIYFNTLIADDSKEMQTEVGEYDVAGETKEDFAGLNLEKKSNELVNEQLDKLKLSDKEIEAMFTSEGQGKKKKEKKKRKKKTKQPSNKKMDLAEKKAEEQPEKNLNSCAMPLALDPNESDVQKWVMVEKRRRTTKTQVPTTADQKPCEQKTQTSKQFNEPREFKENIEPLSVDQSVQTEEIIQEVLMFPPFLCGEDLIDFADAEKLLCYQLSDAQGGDVIAEQSQSVSDSCSGYSLVSDQAHEEKSLTTYTVIAAQLTQASSRNNSTDVEVQTNIIGYKKWFYDYEEFSKSFREIYGEEASSSETSDAVVLKASVG